MRICYVSRETGIHSLRFLKKMREKHDVFCISFSRVKEFLPGVTYYSVPNLFNGFNIASGFAILKASSILKKLINKISPNILHGGFIQTDGLFCTLTNFHPFLLMPWGSDVLIYPQRSAIIKLISKAVIKSADWITCDADVVKTELIRLSGYKSTRISVFPWGIERSRFLRWIGSNEIKYDLQWENKLIFVITRFFEPIYGIQYLLHAIKNMERICTNENLGFIFVGDGSLLKASKSFTEKNKLGNIIHFTGRLNNSQIPRYLASADVYVSPSLSDGTSLSLLEAMTMRLPVIATDIPANREWISHDYNGLLCPPRSINGLVKAIKIMVEEPNKRRNFGLRNSAIAADKADWNKNYKVLEGIYSKLTEI